MKYFEHWSVIICCLVGIIMFGLGVMSMLLIEDWQAQTPPIEVEIEEPKPILEEPEPVQMAETRTIKEWSGTGTKTTEPFIIKEQPWGVQWEHNPKTINGQSVGIFQLRVYKAAGGCIGELTNFVKENSGASCINMTGEFCLVISASNTDWTIVVTAPARSN